MTNTSKKKPAYLFWLTVVLLILKLVGVPIPWWVVIAPIAIGAVILVAALLFAAIVAARR